MSTHWGYYCPTHDIETGRLLNRGEDALSEIWIEREAILKVSDMVVPSISFGSFMGEDPLPFLRAHKDCPVLLASEYGVQRAIEGDEFLYVEEGQWHPHVNSGKVHDHTNRQPPTMHRQCEPVYTRRKVR